MRAARVPTVPTELWGEPSLVSNLTPSASSLGIRKLDERNARRCWRSPTSPTCPPYRAYPHRLLAGRIAKKGRQKNRVLYLFILILVGQVGQLGPALKSRGFLASSLVAGAWTERTVASSGVAKVARLHHPALPLPNLPRRRPWPWRRPCPPHSAGRTTLQAHRRALLPP